MNDEDKKIIRNLVDEMMEVSETNPDVMIYMESLMKNYEILKKENQKLKADYDNLKNIEAFTRAEIVKIKKENKKLQESLKVKK